MRLKNLGSCTLLLSVILSFRTKRKNIGQYLISIFHDVWFEYKIYDCSTLNFANVFKPTILKDIFQFNFLLLLCLTMTKCKFWKDKESFEEQEKLFWLSKITRMAIFANITLHNMFKSWQLLFAQIFSPNNYSMCL